jgi:hypothetical protein
MKCGEVYIMPVYAIAQTSMHNKIRFECECKHITVLPQIHD